MAQVIRFQKVHGKITYTDSLILPDDHNKTEEEIEQLKEAKFQQWIYLRENPSLEEVVAPENT